MTSPPPLSPLSIEQAPIDQLYPNPANPRKNDPAVEHVAASIRRFGFQQPIVVKPGGEIIAGHTRWKAAKSLGLATVPVVRFGGTDLDAVAYGIADNRTHEFATWDEAALVAILTELKREDALGGTGYADEDLDRLAAAVAAATPVDDPGPGEPPPTPVSRSGDLWILGRHRLLCGDSTSSSDVELLLAGHKPGMMITDPPYGVEYDPAWRKAAGVNDSDRMGTVQNDDRVDWSEAYALFPGAVAYVWHADRFAVPVFNQLLASGCEVRAQIIWAKSRLVLSRGHYHWAHEPCWYAVRKGRSAEWCGDRKQSTLWTIGHKEGNEPDSATRHGTQKPVECMERPMRNHSHLEIYEPFSGSGTTIMAAERAGRRCFAMEIDAGYVDVTVERWQKATGRDARLDGGETFERARSERVGAT